jgi:hypothetical protein
MSPLAEAPSRNGDGPKLDFSRYRKAVKTKMKKHDPAVGRRVDPTDEEVDRFLMEASLYGLEPLAGQIYASWADGPMKALTTIDGLRVLAERTGHYDGQSDPEWCDKDGNWTDFWAGEEQPLAARVRVHKKGTKVPTTGTANWHDFAPTGTVGADSLWTMGAGKPAHMLSIRAEALALRKAFPSQLSGLYTAEELGISLAALGASPEGTSSSAVATDVPVAPSAPRPASSPPPSGPVPPLAASSGMEEPTVIVDAVAEQPRGAPARPEAKRTLAEALASSEHQRLRGELTEALFDQLPDRLTDEQSEILAGALADAEEAGITPVELERLCKVALKEEEGTVEIRSRALLEWIAGRRDKAVAQAKLASAEQQSPKESGSGQRELKEENEGCHEPTLLDGDPGPEARE